VTNALRIQAWKELRALLPWWTALAIGIAACGLASQSDVLSSLDARRFLMAAGVGYVAGAVTLGALCIGHEYSHHTLLPTLAHPVGRARLLAVKLAVLIPILLLLTTVTAASVGFDPFFDTPLNLAPQQQFYLPAISGLFLAPWLTMVSRGALPGAVFSIALPLAIFMIGQSFSIAAADIWRAELALAGIGAVMTWRTFMRLEALDGPRAHITLPAWLRRPMADTARLEPPGLWWTLLRKELRLQQMTFVLSAIYAGLWTAIQLARQIDPDTMYLGPTLGSITTLHVGLVALMAGALPSAEERQFGTADWKVLLPVAAWRQWALKAGLAISIAVVLAVGLPVLLEWVSTSPDHLDVDEQTLPVVILLTSAALYVSSMSTSGLRALLASFPAIAVAFVVAITVLFPLSQLVNAGLRPVAKTLVRPGAFDGRAVIDFSWALAIGLFGGLAIVLLVLGFLNDRSAERGRSRVIRQVIWLAAYVLICVIVVAFAAAVFQAGSARP
jgi:hypothetical protein